MITGSGWQPGEAVTLIFQEDPAVHEDYTFAVIADALGNIYWDQWAPEEHDLSVRFYLTAQGSVARAQTTFTDGNVNVKTVGTTGSAAATVNWARFAGIRVREPPSRQARSPPAPTATAPAFLVAPQTHSRCC